MQGEDYTIECLLDYDYIKNHYRLIAVDLSRQKWLNAHLKAIQRIEIAGQLKDVDDYNAIDVYETQTMPLLTILEKITEKRLTFSQEV